MLRVYVANQRESRDFEHAGGPLEFGRGPQRDGTSRCVVNDPFVSKDQLRATLVSAGKVKLENLSKRNPMRVGDSLLVSPGGTHDSNLPVRVTIGKTLIELSDAAEEEDDWGALRTIDQPLNQSFGTSSTGASLQSLIDHGRSPSPEVLAQWFETVVSVQRAAASSAEFFEETANALVQLVGLDSGLVLMRRDDKWQIVAECHKDPDHEVGFSDRILQHVTKERRTFYQALGTDMLTKSLMEIEAVVASPVFAENGGDVIGAVYGSRHHRMGGGGNVEIRPLEAQVVQVLAAAVGAGVARMEHVQESTRRAVLLEQAFTPEVKQALDLDPELFEGRDREVTMLFGDVRAFSRVSEKLGAADTCRLVRDVMECLTKRIREFQGTLVDYMGDGLMAMWNAPADQPDHAELACRAALAMQEELPELNQRWHKVTGEPMRLGIGLNTGNALVGDTGTTYKLKYSALGHTVNLASRVEGATKQLGVPILITGSTYEAVKKKFSTRRLCCVRVVGIHGQVDLFELCSGAVHDSRGAEYAAYEMALSLFEAGKWDECCQTLYSLLSTMGSEPDRPCLNLLSRAVECLRDPPEDFDPVLELKVK